MMRSKLSGTALVVEDNFIIAMDAERMLLELGFTKVAIAGSVDEAHVIIDRMLPDFTLLDLRLGDATGEAIARRLEASGCAFAFATGISDEDEAVEGFADQHVLRKPYGKGDILAAIDRHAALMVSTGSKQPTGRQIKGRLISG